MKAVLTDTKLFY